MKNLQETVFAIVGLGLIGGSYAKALRGQKVQKILGLDTNPIVTLMAKDEGYITDNIDECPERLKEADVIVCAMYPGAFVPFVKEHVKDFKPDVLLTDVMGIKGDLPDQVDALLGPDMDFVPTHPMAGREGKGYSQSTSLIFPGSNFIIIKRDNNRPEHVKWLTDMAYELGCGRVVELTGPEHDSIIAYTSDLPHIMAVSLVNSDSMQEDTKQFVAGSFRDATRVADINASLWSDLFLLNRDKVVVEINRLEEQLEHWKTALQVGDKDELELMMNRAKKRRRDMFYGKNQR
ncbi:prephenate dehydrogenase [Acidaminococcus sp. NSJ-142]|jgi:prephenate dehydrogenase|uniref:prephenate dehydrogenase n=1 Tax=Acidaminococcus TaxID=904 RepID=UPI000E467A89|nr:MULTISPECIES: prephenate dehydrogenase [Acidaminococcus]MCD2435132.1 prephenate dehydrogenase [Acidaminococcus hominis]RHK02969.1 prephenate dehydrogenase [Acidaminococcus sp. AM05-11]